MSIRVMNRVWDLSQAEGGALLALLTLADNAGDDGYAWPSIETIAKRSRLSERQTSNVLAQLREAGEIDYIRGRGRGNVSVFVVLVGLSDQERAEKVQFLHLKAAEILKSFQVLREQKAKNLRLLAAEKRGKGEMAIADQGVQTPDPALIHGGINTTTTTMGEVPANDRPAGGGGREASQRTPDQHPETAVILEAAGVLSAVSFQDIPPDVARAAVKQARTHKNPTNFGGLVASLLIKYRTGAWSPPAARPRPEPEPAPAEPERILSPEERQESARRWARERGRTYWTGGAA